MTTPPHLANHAAAKAGETAGARAWARAAVAGLLAFAGWSAAGCSVGDITSMSQLGVLSDALEHHQQDRQDLSQPAAATVDLFELQPKAKQIVLVCPYTTHTASEILGEEVLKNRETDDSHNWVVYKLDNGATVIEEFRLDDVLLCTDVVNQTQELLPGETLTFSKSGGIWELTAKN